ncbi:MAG: hypothetical protein D6B26_06500 [Spirochaetaceae bacterium]|nr:MAG: hypothetical protein D6B26_06500 [Spirochaetaceae bacterium]
MELILKDRYLLAAYIFFRNNEEILDEVQLELFGIMQKQIFQTMTLEEVEKIDEIYSDQID